MVYQPTTGLLANTTLGNVNDGLGYNRFGELQSYRANVGATPLFQTSYAHDNLGRITTLTETVDSTTNLYVYGYDAAGRLATVIRNGAQIASYGYDANGNRVTATDLTGTFTGSYDDQDRLLSYGSNTYSYTPNGELTTKVAGGQTTTYRYDEFGNLTQVVLPDTTTITYLIDGKDRRIGKRVNGALQKGWLYEDQLRPVAELDGSGAVVSRFVYATRVNVPDYMVKAGVTYRLVLDHLGSVRLVVNSQSGQVVQRMDYDAWGMITLDTNPGFQPFGFAGGLWDGQTGLVRFGARDYDPAVGRWTTKDPVGFAGGSANLYNYVDNQPVNQTDSYGLYNPVKGLAALLNYANALRLWGTGAAKILLTGGLNTAWGVWNFNSGLAAFNRAYQQAQEAWCESWADASWKNLHGILPFGQHFDDLSEPMWYQFYWDLIHNRPTSMWDLIKEFGTLGL